MCCFDHRQIEAWEWENRSGGLQDGWENLGVDSMNAFLKAM